MTPHRDPRGGHAGGNDDAPAAAPLPTMRCRAAADLYSRGGRQMIARLLRRPLQAWKLTPIELLHDLAAYRRLANAGSTLQKAVQLAAAGQAHAKDEPVGARVRQLQDAIDTAVCTLHRLEKERLPGLAETPLDRAAAAIRAEEFRDRLFGAMLVARLRDCKTPDDKLEALAGLLESPFPDWAVAILDAFLSEQLVFGGSLETRFEAESFSSRLEHFVKLSAGSFRPAVHDAASLQEINRTIADGRLPETSACLLDYVFDTLAANRRVTKSHLSAEFAALHGLLAAIDDGEAEEGLRRWLYESFEQRCARLLHPLTLAADLAEVEYLPSRIERLFDLADHAIGSRNLATIGVCAQEILDDPEKRAFWRDPVGASREQRMKTLARLQQRALSGRLPESMRETLAGRFDRICVELLDRSELIERLAAEVASPAERCKRLLRLLAETEVTRGVASRRVRAAIESCLSDPAFPASLQRANSEAERHANMLDFQRLLARAGLADKFEVAAPNLG